MGPRVFDDDMFAEVGGVFVGDDLVNDAVEYAEHIVVRHEGRFFAFKVGLRRTIGEENARGLTCRRDVDGDNVATAMEAIPAVARPTGLAVVRVHARAREEFLGRVEERMIRRRPADV